MAHINPTQLLDKQFKKVFKGFEPSEVLTTVRDAAETIDDLQEENAELKSHVQQMELELDKYQRLQESLNAALITAQKSAEETRSAARQEAESTIRDAQAKAKEILFAVRQAVRKTEEELAQVRHSKEKFMIDFEALLNSNLEWLRSQPKTVEQNYEEELIPGESSTTEKSEEGAS